MRLLFWLGLPLVLPQALVVRARATRLPPADGPDRGVVGDGPVRRLLAFGDSIIAGTGVAALVDAMPGQLARALAERHGARVEWRALGTNGWTAADLLAALDRLEGTPEPDWIFLSVGVNDTTSLTLGRAYRERLSRLLDVLTERAPAATVLLAGIPPMQRFPALPEPLATVFGWRAARLDGIAARVARERPRVRHLPTPVPDDPAAFAADGYHPNAAACALWAGAVAQASG
jgi:lysophospholipase L1-like esterase